MANNLSSSQIDELEVDSIISKVEENGGYIDNITEKVVKEYSRCLDTYMQYISTKLNSTNDLLDTELDDMCLKLPNLMYFVGQGQEALGIKEDVSKAVKQELYNKVFMESIGTIKDKDSSAELKTQQETIVNIIYARAYKKIKARLDYAMEMLASVKKVISRRMQELALSTMKSGVDIPNNFRSDE
jgi:hypothetical protein